MEWTHFELQELPISGIISMLSYPRCKGDAYKGEIGLPQTMKAETHSPGEETGVPSAIMVERKRSSDVAWNLARCPVPYKRK